MRIGNGLRFVDAENFDPRAVRWFQRLYGAALLANVATEAWQGIWSVHAGALYPWRHLPFVPMYPPFALAIEWALTAGAGLALVASVRTSVAWRVAAVATLAALTQRYSNHGALLFLVAFYAALDPPRPDAPGFHSAPCYNLGLVRAQLVIVYVFSVANKLAHGFASGDSLRNLLALAPGAARALSLATLVVELALPVALLLRPRLGILGVAALHLAFAARIAGLASFGLVMVAMAFTFLPPERAGDASGGASAVR